MIDLSSYSGYDGDHWPEVKITYERPETDEEWAARSADVERWVALWRQRDEDAERAEFERLRKKFGGKR